MKAAAWMAIALLVFGAKLGAADETLPILKVGTEVYSNVTVTTVTATDIYFTYAKGMGNAKLKDLDRSLQRHFHYNSTNAAVALQKQREATAQVRADLLSNAAKPPTRRVIDDSDDFVAPQLNARSFRGKHPPDISVAQWLTPAPDVNGKFILVDFWATWCAPCRQSIPHLNGLAARFKDQVVVIGISDEPASDIVKMASPKILYYVGTDTEARSSKAVGVTAIPHSLLIDPDGFVRFEGNPIYLTEERLAQLVRKYSP